MLLQKLGRYIFKIELQAAREHGNGNLLRICRCQQKLYIRRRLFQSFEHCVKGVIRQHVDFIDHVDLKAARGRGELGLLEQLLNLTHTAIGGSINLDVIHKTAAIDLTAGAADPTGVCAHAGLAIQCLGNNPGQSGLASPAGARQ